MCAKKLSLAYLYECESQKFSSANFLTPKNKQLYHSSLTVMTPVVGAFCSVTSCTK